MVMFRPGLQLEHFGDQYKIRVKLFPSLKKYKSVLWLKKNFCPTDTYQQLSKWSRTLKCPHCIHIKNTSSLKLPNKTWNDDQDIFPNLPILNFSAVPEFYKLWSQTFATANYTGFLTKEDAIIGRLM